MYQACFNIAAIFMRKRRLHNELFFEMFQQDQQPEEHCQPPVLFTPHIIITVPVMPQPLNDDSTQVQPTDA